MQRGSHLKEFFLCAPAALRENKKYGSTETDIFFLHTSLHRIFYINLRGKKLPWRRDPSS